MAPEPWEFGWDALVAIGTISLALATVVLALITRRVAKAAADEVQAQSRPVLVPAIGATKPITVTTKFVRIRIRNAGQGPAFAIRCRLQPTDASPDAWHHGILEPGNEVTLRFPAPEVEPEDGYQLKAEYSDLAGRGHWSALVIRRVTYRHGTELRRSWAFVEVPTGRSS